jgi:hypothetical protein
MCRQKYRVHSFEYQGFIIWGLTASILINVAQLALGRSADFAIYAKGEVQERQQQQEQGQEQTQQQQQEGRLDDRQQQQGGIEEGPVAPDPALDGEESLSTL